MVNKIKDFKIIGSYKDHYKRIIKHADLKVWLSDLEETYKDMGLVTETSKAIYWIRRSGNDTKAGRFYFIFVDAYWEIRKKYESDRDKYSEAFSILFSLERTSWKLPEYFSR